MGPSGACDRPRAECGRTLPFMRRRRHALTLVVATAALSLGLAGCNNDSSSTPSPSSTSSSSSSTSSTSPEKPGLSVPADETAGPGPTGPGGSCPANTDPSSSSTTAATGRGEVTAVRAAHQPGFDRLVWEFKDAAPGYRVAYTKRPITEDASGREVEVKGAAVLEVRMEPASGYHFAGDASGPTYTGPKRIRPATTVVEEVVETGDFEAVLTWVVGLRTRSGFRVRTLSAPPRIMVEVCA
ncbi:MAG: hypothetical protein QOK43_2358 [Acidimicrobiaceae bacterium]|nr:hypothetical protein [Acidimicrobiaceae bacterium]